MKICSLSYYLIAICGYKYHCVAASSSSSSVTAEGDVVSSVTFHQVSIVVMFLSLERYIVDIVFWAGWVVCPERVARETDMYYWIHYIICQMFTFMWSVLQWITMWRRIEGRRGYNSSFKFCSHHVSLFFKPISIL